MAKQPRRGAERRSSRAIREPYARALIVCEGSKTEPFYLRDLCADLRISSANIQIVGSGGIGSSPSTLVEYALNTLNRDDDFEYVFCVFDRDAHQDYDAARGRLRSVKRKNRNGEQVQFAAVTSNPSFEFWLRLHFADTDRPYLAVGGRSSGDQVLSDLKQDFPDYQKGHNGIYHALKDRLPLAMTRAHRVNILDLENPHTRIVDLVEWLQEIKKGNKPDVS